MTHGSLSSTRGERHKVLLTGGRSLVALELARILHRAGHSVYGAESLAGNFFELTNAITEAYRLPSPRIHFGGFQTALLRIITEQQIEVLIPTCEEALYIAKIKDQIPRSCRVLVDDFERVRSLHHKFDFLELVQRLDLPAPHTELLNSAEAIEHYQVTRPVVLKPAYSRFGAQTRIVRTQAEYDHGQLTAVAGNPWLAQEYIAGRQICTYSIAYRGKLLAHTVYYSPFTLGLGASVYFASVKHSAAEKWVRRFVAAYRLTGQFGFDLIETPDGELYPIECNPRTTSGIHLLASHRGIAQVFLGQSSKLIAPIDSRPAMVLLPLLVARQQPQLGQAPLSRWTAIRRARDVVFSLSDPLPLFGQFLLLLRFAVIAWQGRISLTQATSVDIEYAGDV